MAEDATSVSAPPPVPTVRPPLGPVWWTLFLAFAAGLMFAIYAVVVFFATVSSCGSDQFFGISYASGGPVETVPTAGVIAGVLFVAAALVGWRFPRRHLSLFLAFAAVYAVALVVLWEITPAVWGAGICPGAVPAHVMEQIGPILRGGSSEIEGVAFGRDSRILASSNADGTTGFWDVRRQREIGRPWRTTDAAGAAAFSPDRRLLATGACDGGTVRLWDVRRHTQVGKTLIADETGACVNDVSFSPDGRTLVSASYNGRVRLWDVTSHTELGRPLGPDDDVFNAVAFIPNGRIVAAGANVNYGSGGVFLWNVHGHRQPIVVYHGSEPIETVAFSPNGRLIAFGDDDGVQGAVHVWDIRDHEQLGSPYTGPDIPDSLAFSPNSRVLAASFNDGTVQLWDVHTHHELDALSNVGARRLAFSRDGRILAIGNSDGSIRLFSVRALTGTD